MANGEHRNALPKGFELEGFRIESVLGAGGFGVTYLAKEVAHDRWVAIKEYLPSGVATRGDDKVSVHPISDSDKEDFDYGLTRFGDEARTLVAFQHPNIVRVHRYFEANGSAYLVMEYQEGMTLHEILARDGALPEDEVLDLLYPLLEGLERVHANGFLHRDIKPGNIIIRTDGTPALIDFGAARHALGGRSKSLTSIITEGYAPFEQYSSRGNQGPWTDIYALGATLYQTITGERPPDAATRVEDDPYVPVAKTLKGEYSAPFLAAIDAALAPRAADRPQSIADWRAMIEGGALAPGQGGATVQAGERAAQAIAERAGAAPTRRATKGGGVSGRALVFALVGLIIAGAAGAGGYWGWSSYQEAERKRVEAVAAKRREELARKEAERRQEEALRAQRERQRLRDARRRAEQEDRKKAEEAKRKREERKRKAKEAERRRAEEAKRKKQAERKRRKKEAARKRAEKAKRRRELLARQPYRRILGRWCRAGWTVFFSQRAFIWRRNRDKLRASYRILGYSARGRHIVVVYVIPSKGVWRAAFTRFSANNRSMIQTGIKSQRAPRWRQLNVKWRRC